LIYFLTITYMDYNFLVQADLKMINVIKDFITEYKITLWQDKNFIPKSVLYKDFINTWSNKKVNTEKEYNEYLRAKHVLFSY